ncbi:auxin-binding protein, partial [Mesorhizobium sp. M7A.F.Ca.US.007.01.1.1]
MASIWRYLLAGLGLAALLVGILAVVFLTAPRSSLPAGPDVARTKKTDNGLY